MSRPMRMFAIVERLRGARHPLTARRLADDLDVVPRTIYRDVAALQALHVPVLGEPGVGYVLGQGFDLPPLAFTAEELEAVLLGLSLLERTGDTGLRRAATGTASKILAASVAHAGCPDDVGLFASGFHAMPSTCVRVDELREHVREARGLDIAYRDGTGRRTVRRVLPVALIYYVESVVLAAWCALRDDFRHFRIDRLERCTPDGTRFGSRGVRLRRTWLEGREREGKGVAAVNRGTG